MSNRLWLLSLAACMTAVSVQAQDASITLPLKSGPVDLIPSTRYRAVQVPGIGDQARVDRVGASRLEWRVGPSAVAPAPASRAGDSIVLSDASTMARLMARAPRGTAALPVYQFGGLDVVLTREVIVRFEGSVSPEQQAQLAASLGATSRPVMGSPGRVFSLSSPRSVPAALQELNGRPEVRFAEPNLVAIFPPRPGVRARPVGIGPSGPATPANPTATYPSDTLFRQQWALRSAGSGSYGIGVIEAWKASADTSAVTIAILDEGVDATHPDLKDKIVFPFDATTGLVGQTPNAWDAHGTACAGIAAAVTDNQLGVAGVATTARIMPIKIASSRQPGPDGVKEWTTTMEAVGVGIRRAVDSGADILSNSWNGGEFAEMSSFVRESLEYALTTGRSGRGAVVIFSAGNKAGPVIWPATLARSLEIITVAATNEWDELKTSASRDGEEWWDSSVGPEVTVGAPGVHLVTTDNAGAGGFTAGDYVETFNGTSGAAPHVAGVAALLLALHPDWTARQVRDRIAATADFPVHLGDGTAAAFGRLNACKALGLLTCD